MVHTKVASEDPDIRARLVELDQLYAEVPKKREPHPDIGCWWTLYDYGADVVQTWAKDYKHPYPGGFRADCLGTFAAAMRASYLHPEA